jgi:phosphoglycerate kinase
MVNLKDINVSNKKVLLRTDYNIKVDKGEIVNDYRIRASLPTIKYLLDQGAAIIIVSHFGRPDGQIKKEYSLEPIAKRLSSLLGQDVSFCSETIGDKASDQAHKLLPKDILVLENIRFLPGEEKNDLGLGKELSKLADVYVDDAFGCVHRAHSSISSVATFFDIQHKAAGFLLEREVQKLSMLITNPAKPYTAIMGGAKISDKLPVLKNLVANIDYLLIGGAMANTFLYYQKVDIGASVAERDMNDQVKDVYDLCNQHGVKVLLPIDVIVGNSIDDIKVVAKGLSEVSGDDMILDLGSKTIESWRPYIEKSKTIFWNGTVGFSERKPFALASIKLSDYLILAQEHGSEVVVGGGDTAAFLDQIGKLEVYNFVSTGGGASLDLLSGLDLPGISALS